MSLLSQLIGVANTLTQSLGVAADVTYIAASLTNGAGKEVSPSAPVTRKAIVNKQQKLIKGPTGELVMSQAYVAFLDPAPISMYDQIILADGTTGPILSVQAFIDGSNGPILSEVYLGF
jgi:hypothetical protein